MTDHLDELSTDTGCPKCGSQFTTTVKFTWWGGLLGPKLLHHTKCNECKYLFNSKTRQSNTTAIIIYPLMVFVIIFALYYALGRR